MLTRKQFLFMLLLSCIGTAFAYYAQKLIDWHGALEWLKRIQVYEFMAVVGVVLVVVFVIWINDSVRKWADDKDEREARKEEHKESVAVKVMARKQKSELY